MTSFDLFCAFTIIVAVFPVTDSFLPNRNSAILPEDFTLEDITRIGTIRALGGECDPITKVDLDKYSNEWTYGKFKEVFEDASLVQHAIEDIVTNNVLVNVRFHGNPVWQFSNEKILEDVNCPFDLQMSEWCKDGKYGFSPYATTGYYCQPSANSVDPDQTASNSSSDQSPHCSLLIAIFLTYNRKGLVDIVDLPRKAQKGHELLVQLRDRLLFTLLSEEPNFASARETLGHILHLIQVFYSNTNWPEHYGHAIYKDLGQPGQWPLLPVAPRAIDTCITCGEAYNISCMRNIINNQFLTSGYTGHRHLAEDGDAVERYSGKCRHGGPIPQDTPSFTVPGGINKQSSYQGNSPHYHLHATAAMLAVSHTTQYLCNPDFGLTAVIGPVKFGQLFGLSSRALHVYLDIDDPIMTGILRKQLLNESIHVIHEPSVEQACLHAAGYLVVLRMRRDLQEVDESLPSVCSDHHVRPILVTPSTDKRWKRSATAGMDFYDLIAEVSGGTVYHASKANIGEVVDIIKESVSSTPPVTVMKFKMNNGTTVTIPVDKEILNLTIKIQGPRLALQNVKLFKPGGTEERFSDPAVATSKALGSRLKVIKLRAPSAGEWVLQRPATYELEVDVTARSDLDFTYKLMQPGPGGFGEYPLVGRPIAGMNTSVQVSVPLVERVTSVDQLLLLDTNGTVTSSVRLYNVGGRRGKTLFKAYLIIPHEAFKMAVEGKDKSGNTFRRLDPKLVSTLAIKLEVLPLSGTLYVSKSVTIPFRVSNVGAATANIVVAIQDDKNFANAPLNITCSLKSGASCHGSFVLMAGTTKGVTTTVTISAKIVGASSGKVQYNVQRITVEEKVVRAVDNANPTCNVTSTLGTCDLGTDLCACSNHTWSMTAEIGDVGFGLQAVFVSGAGNQSVFTNDNFSIGATVDKQVVQAKLSADCCHQHAKITAVDLAGNVGLCDVTITPRFVAPDPRLCQKSSPTVNNATTISCNTTDISGSCDLTIACNGSDCADDELCKQVHWSMNASLGAEGYGRLQVIPVNAGRNSTFTRNNRSLSLTTDCCHPSVSIKAVDIAGSVGECKASIAVKTHAKPSPPPTTSDNSSGGPSIGLLAGGAGGGVVALGGIAGLAFYLKKRLATSNKLRPDDATEVQDVSE